jgi:hypothetical protein
MEFLKLVRRRSFISAVVYAALNIGFAIALAAVVFATESILLAIALVLISKWRVLAVRMRYWFANVQTNLVDFIVSLSAAFLMYDIAITDITDSQKLLSLGVVTIVYIVWLLIIKPRSSRLFIVLQAAIALFGGVSVLYSESYGWPVSLVVIAMWLIGYSVARHVLSSHDETYLLPMSMMWGVVMAEIGWIAYHWTVGYRVPFVSDLHIPQISIIVMLMSFVAYKAYSSFYHHQKIRGSDIVMPLLFTIGIVIVLLVLFNGLDSSI